MAGGTRTLPTPRPPRAIYFFFAAFFLVAFFLVAFFLVAFFFFAGINSIPLSVHRLDSEAPLQHIGSQRAPHTTGRVGSPHTPVKRFSGPDGAHAVGPNRVTLWKDVWKSLKAAPGAFLRSPIPRRCCGSGSSEDDASRESDLVETHASYILIVIGIVFVARLTGE